jgi:hypothetical protein
MAKSAGAVLLGVSLGVLLSGSVGAQETTEATLRADSTAGFSGAGEECVAGLKSGTTAFLWSFLGTAVPAVAGAYDVYRAGSSDSVVPRCVFRGMRAIHSGGSGPPVPIDGGQPPGPVGPGLPAPERGAGATHRGARERPVIRGSRGSPNGCAWYLSRG